MQVVHIAPSTARIPRAQLACAISDRTTALMPTLALPLASGFHIIIEARGEQLSASPGPGTCHTGPMPVNTRCAAVLAGTALLGIGLDQATKVLLAATLEGEPPIRIIGHVLTIYISRNSGAAFGFAPAATVLFSCVAVAVAVLIVTKVPRLCSVGWAAALGLLLAGAVGNLCDRLMRAPGFGRGAVVDFIDLQHFADFNVADICLTCGVALVILLSLRSIPMTDQLGEYARSAPARRAHL
jgi:signal peptidase II